MGGNIRVFIVDDSTVFRSQIRAAIEGQSGIEIVGFAGDGKMACESLKHKKVDVVTMDLEMPIMDGLSTLAELNRLGIKPQILVFSALSKAGAEATLSALQLGASDFLLKPTLQPGSTQTPAEVIRSMLLPKILQLVPKMADVTPLPVEKPVVASPPPSNNFPKFNFRSFTPSAIFIASSTGGPNALEKMFAELRGPLNCPILIAQHMPPIFTATLAERLQRVSGLPVAEAIHMAEAKKGHVYIAPGDFHMRVEMINGQLTTLLDQGPLRNSVRPAADFLFESGAKVYRNTALGIVLTGMGYDGRDGALAIKQGGGGIFIQDKESCVVFGMPGAVFADQTYDKMTDVHGIVNLLSELGVCPPPRSN
jgi:two-component system, chemotaxis family, protein-glutamate methylesterase/glutaminase